MRKVITTLATTAPEVSLERTDSLPAPQMTPQERRTASSETFQELTAHCERVLGKLSETNDPKQRLSLLKELRVLVERTELMARQPAKLK